MHAENFEQGREIFKAVLMAHFILFLHLLIIAGLGVLVIFLMNDFKKAGIKTDIGYRFKSTRPSKPFMEIYLPSCKALFRLSASCLNW